jgi:hypothetical protein
MKIRSQLKGGIYDFDVVHTQVIRNFAARHTNHIKQKRG